MEELKSGYRLQSSLGNTTVTRASSDNTVGSTATSKVDSLVLGRVTSINYQNNTVKYIVVSTGSSADAAKTGSNEALLPMLFAGRNGYGRSYGEVEPIVVGDILLIGFVGGSTTQPFVIARYPDASIAKELTAQNSDTYAADDENSYAETHRRMTVYPDQTYDFHDGAGRQELTFSGETFLLVRPDIPASSAINDDGESPMSSADLIGAIDGSNTDRIPLNEKAPEIIFGHRGRMKDDGVTQDQHRMYLYIGQDGTYRTSMMQNDEDWRTYFEQTPEGKIRLRRQGDAKMFGTGTDTSEIGIDENGYVTIRSQSTGLVLKPDGIYNVDGTPFTVDTDLTDIEKKIVDLNSTVVANDKKTTTQFEIQDGKISSKVSSEELVDTLGNQINTYSEQLSETTTTLNGYKDTLHAMSADGTIDDTELASLKSIWSDLSVACPILVSNADKYGVSHTELDASYSELSVYASSVITTGGGAIDTAEFNSKFDTYIANDVTTNTDVYNAIVDSVSPYGATVRKLSTDIEQTDAKIEANAKEIDKQGGRLTEAEAKLTITAQEIASKVSSSDVAEAVSNSVYGTSTGHINLYVKHNATSNKELSNGVVVDYAGAYVSDYLAVDPSIKYMLYTDSTLGNTTLSYAWYNSNKEYISGDSKVSDYDMEYTLTPPSNTAYIRVSINNATNMMLERGYIKSGYIQAYADAYASGTTQAVIDQANNDQSSAQSLYDTANSNKSTEPGKISSLVSEGILSSDERSALQTYLTNYASLYNTDNSLSQVYNVDDSSYTSALNALTQYVQPLLDSGSTTIDGDKSMSLFNQYYTERLNFIAQILAVAKGNVNSSINQVQQDVNGLASSTTQKFSEIEQTSGEIKQTVSEVATTANNASDKINNLQVGGTNLLPNTIDFSSWQMSSGVSIDSTIYPEVAHYPSFTAGSADIDFLQYASLTNLVANTTYTFSFSAKGSGNLNVLIYPNVSTSSPEDNFHQYALTSAYQKYSFTFTTSSNISGTKNVLFRNSKGNTLEAYITQVKLEQGNVATDWSPAPNDGLGIKSTTIMYQLGDSETTPPDGTWLEAVPTLIKGMYLWTRTTLIYTDNSSESIYSVTYIAKDGNDGADGTSPINLVIDSSNGYQFKNNIINTTFTAILYQDNKEIDSDGTKFAYVWSKTNADGTADTAWNLAHQTSQKSITITSSDVLRRATFDCTAESLN